MSTIDDVMDQVLTATNQILTAAHLPNWQAYKGWPLPEDLDVSLTNRECHISIYPMPKGNKRTDVPINSPLQTVDPDIQLTATISSTQLQGADGTNPATGTITFGGVSTDGTILLIKIGDFYVSLDSTKADTPATVAQNYADTINLDTDASTLVVASAVGPNLILTSLTADPANNAIEFWTRIGGTAVLVQKIREQQAYIQLHIWAYDNDSRELFSDALDTGLAETNFLIATDGTPIRLLFDHQEQTDAEIRSGIYRRGLYYMVQYDTTRTTEGYSVLEGLVTVVSP